MATAVTRHTVSLRVAPITTASQPPLAASKCPGRGPLTAPAEHRLALAHYTGRSTRATGHAKIDVKYAHTSLTCCRHNLPGGDCRTRKKSPHFSVDKQVCGSVKMLFSVTMQLHGC